jgi:putative addiction module component (TIGR02574 family)
MGGETPNMSLANDLMTRAMNLSVQERAALAHRLLLSLEPDDFDEDSENAWTAEIEARITQVESGAYSASDWPEAQARIRRAILREQSP